MQALSSYVYIAANVMIHAKAEVQHKHLDDLLPPLIPLLTSHHHTLRGFTQVFFVLHLTDFFFLVDLFPCTVKFLYIYVIFFKNFQLLAYQVFCKLLPTVDSCSGSIILEKRCLSNLKSYLESNPDCARY